ncbi:MAG: hypothetical protein HN742_29545 [Lentisphaerae bacterium]|nr:hypothetical protein [Lentisphaerota bacterium]MBT4821638.1 hypothetical protein [Lentisphaerota bacterium]MBT5609042.1 hypothetical protein [Lentisphaerota bacterium]MBT7055474.1 hypothetical protein [Lentisphaerota bacterium]MBT7846053.1 hypothetical protein [Lentisphaerota bacterium]
MIVLPNTCLSLAALCAGLTMASTSDAAARTRRDVYVTPGAVDGVGSRDQPYGSIQEALDEREEDWGQVFLGPGIYREDITVERDGVWFFPWRQYDVVIEGSITIKGKDIALRGFTFRSKEKAVVIEATAGSCQVQNNRIVELADGGTGIHVEGGALIIGNVVDLRQCEAKGTVGLRLRSGGSSLPRVDHNRIAGADLGIVVEPGRPTAATWSITHNEVRECANGLRVLADGVVAKYNRLWRCTGPGLQVQGEGCTVEHNAVFANSDPTNETSPEADKTLPEAPAEGRTLHVAVASTPEGDGSEKRPFATLAQALADLKPGDTVIIGDGEYRESVTLSVLAPANAPVTIRSKTRHAAVVVEGRLLLDDCANVHIGGLKFVASPSAVQFGPDARHCSVSDCLLVTTKDKPSSTISVSGPSASHNLIEDCVLQGNGRKQVGIQLNCQRFNQHCTIRRCVVSGHYYAVQTGGGSYPTAPPGFHVIEDCDFFENQDGVHHKMTDCIVRNCDLHHNTGHGVTVRYGARQLIHGNRIHHNSTGIRLHSPSHLVRDNLIYANTKGGIIATVIMGEPFYDPPTSNVVANNTFWENGRHAIRLEQGARLVWLRNIFVGQSPDQWLIVRETTGRKAPWDQSGTIRMADFNLYHNGRVPLLTEHEGGEHDLFVDPKLVDPENGDFTLAPDSPARDAVPETWDALPPIPFATGLDQQWRTLGASANSRGGR